MTPDERNPRQLAHHEVSIVRRVFPVRVLACDIALGENVGSLFRLCDALGVSRLHLAGSTSIPPHPKIRKAARATEKAVPFQHDPDAVALLDELRSEGWLIAAIEVTSTSRDIRDLAGETYERICLVLGAERHGLSQPVLDRCHMSFEIPMFGQNTSLNVATAASIALFEASKRFFARPEALRAEPSTTKGGRYIQLSSAE